jgi:basic amino acid/polyamine antiporter, APA family
MTRHLGLASAIALVVGQVIAVGIFLTPASMARALGSPFWLLVVWIVSGGMALAGALVYGELAARYPEAGGGYVYLREAFGPRVAFLYGWKCCLVMDPGITAALATGLASYAAYYMALSPLELKLVALAAIGAAATVNVLGVRLGAGAVTLLTVLKVGALAVIVVGAFGLGRGSWSHFAPFVEQRPGSGALMPALAGAFVSAFFAFGGWWEAAKLAGEVRDPERVMPRALAWGVALVTLAYILTSAAFIRLVPIDAVTSGETFAAQAGEALFGPAGGAVLAGVVIVSVAGSLVAVMMMLPRLYYAMGRDGLFPPALGKLHPRFGTPARAIGLQAALASVLVAVGSFDDIIAYFIFITVAFIGLSVAGLYRLRRRDTASPSPSYRTPGYPVTPAVFVTLVGVLLVLLVANRPVQALAGAAIVALGIPAYALIERRRRGTLAEEAEAP